MNFFNVYGSDYHVAVSREIYPNLHEVVFQDFINGISVNVHVHWTQVFEYADRNPCGGFPINYVVWNDGTKTFASGRFIEGKLVGITVGAYGDTLIHRHAGFATNESNSPTCNHSVCLCGDIRKSLAKAEGK